MCLVPGSVCRDRIKADPGISCASSARNRHWCSIEAKINFDDVFPELVKAAVEWAKRCASGIADFETKRNLIMSTIETLGYVERTETRIKFKMKLIMSSSVEWWSLQDSNL